MEAPPRPRMSSRTSAVPERLGLNDSWAQARASSWVSSGAVVDMPPARAPARVARTHEAVVDDEQTEAPSQPRVSSRKSAMPDRLGLNDTWAQGSARSWASSTAAIVAPPPAAAYDLRKGDFVMAQFGVLAEEYWWQGTIVRVHHDGTVDVLYDDGDKEERNALLSVCG